MRQFIEFLRKLGNWLPLFFRWFIVEPKKIWFTLFPIFIGVIFCWLIPAGIFNGPILNDTFETRFRLTGLSLELLGIVTVVYGLNAALKLFDVERLWEIIPKWFKRCPNFRGDSRIIVGSINVTLEAATGSAFGTSTLTPNSSIENRVTFLEEQLKQVHLQLYKNRIDFENKFQKSSDALNTERCEREAGDKQAQQALKEFAVGDVYIELMGIIWLIFGAIFATASTELASIFCSSPF